MLNTAPVSSLEDEVQSAGSPPAFDTSEIKVAHYIDSEENPQGHKTAQQAWGNPMMATYILMRRRLVPATVTPEQYPVIGEILQQHQIEHLVNMYVPNFSILMLGNLTFVPDLTDISRPG
jgi:hypothetical protein